MIKRVILWDNGNVMVFDEAGEQVPHYQGRIVDAIPKLLADAPSSTRWEMGSRGAGYEVITRAAMEGHLEVARRIEGKEARDERNLDGDTVAA